MKGIDTWSLGAGIVLTLAGLVLLIVSFFVSLWILMYSIPALVIGIVILATLRKQEHVEPIKEASNIKEEK